MTKREYMQQLRRALEGYEQGFLQEILESYGEHFEAGLKSGRSEEEICRELGDIEELLREMGAQPLGHPVGPDRPEALERALETAITPELYDELEREMVSGG